MFPGIGVHDVRGTSVLHRPEQRQSPTSQRRICLDTDIACKDSQDFRFIIFLKKNKEQILLLFTNSAQIRFRHHFHHRLV